MAKPPPTKAASAPANLLSAVPEHLSARLFDHAKPVKLAADEVLFLAGDPGDGCYQVEQGLLKVSIIGPSGAERILAILGPGAIVGELSTIDGKTALGFGHGGARFRTPLHQPHGIRHLREGASGSLRTHRQAARGAAARHRRGARGRKLPAAEGARGACAARSFRGVRPAGRPGPHPHPPEDQPERRGRHGRDRARERQPHPE